MQDPQDLSPPATSTPHPTVRVMVLAWAAAAAQTPMAAWAWLSCLALGLVTHRIAPRGAASLSSTHPPPLSPSRAPRDTPNPRPPVARRRTDAAGAAAKPSLPVLAAHRDTLTGLSTLQALQDDGTAWADDLHARGLSLCVLHVGLDGLEPLIQRYGRDAGDQLLRQVAKRLRHLAREEDRVMRFEGDEFVLLLACPNAECISFTRTMSARIKAELQRPLAYRTLSNLRIGCRVGSGIWPLHGHTLSAVLEHAAEMLASIRPRQAEPLDAT
jgi:diguanylate cyclase (GGDEF)-like protein